MGSSCVNQFLEMFIPNELLLNVLLFADFSTLVYAKFVDTKFLGVVTANEHLLAVQHRFHIIFLNMGIVYSDLTKSGLRKIMHYSRSKPASVERACRNLADVIGQHAVVILCFAEQASVKPAVDVIFELIPALKFTQDGRINIPHGWHAGGNSEAVMRNFARLKSLSLDIDHDLDLFRHFNWSFLSLDAARELRTVTVTLTNRSSKFYMEYDASAAVQLMTSVSILELAHCQGDL